MENKKLLKYLLKDLSELDEMFSETGKNSFDEMEIEFIQNRISGAKRLVQLIIDHSNEVSAENKPATVTEEKPTDENTSVLEEKTIEQKEEKLTGNRWVEAKSTVKSEEKLIESGSEENPVQQESEEIPEPVSEVELTVTAEEKHVIEIQKTVVKERIGIIQQELKLEENEPVDIHHKKLGDSFLKEKSVNDLIGEDFSKLEHKLSNRPVSSIQGAIGINDRFQYIRELFEGSTDSFSKTVADLDSMSDIKEAVNYLQAHFKWKKNETSLKFVNLIKRRFPNE